MGKPIKRNTSSEAVTATCAQPGPVAEAAGFDVSQEQAFATGISRPQPAQAAAVAEAVGFDVSQEQAFATGISRPQPAQD